MGNQASAEGAETQPVAWYTIVIYIVIFGAFIYFLIIRPQRKQKKQQQETMQSIEAGDSIMTTSGFYGTVVATNGDTIIVEFGNNKNCRIPMSKQAIAQLEKANAQANAGAASVSSEPKKKFFGKKKAAEEEAMARAEAQAAQVEARAEEAAKAEEAKAESEE
ncbi:MAG: preprotein translocase subunit YajC [Parasporobacterium sp.]|nr:preprotein translocase subunit YajC [Parasporobacterium sp.]